MKDLKWSVYFQNPEYMELTRMTMVLPEYEPLIRSWCGIKDGAKVLDVGCGTGCFTRLLAGGGEEISVTGIDADDVFIGYAKEKAAEKGIDITFVRGDALQLPFDDDSFDTVASHTFLTSMPDPEGALSEMIRVVKPGGIIASVTCMNFYPSAVSFGHYPRECDAWKQELQDLFIELTRAYMALDPVSDRAAGTAPAEMPHLFASHSLEQVSAYPVGHLSSLSNAAMTDADKLRWIDLYQESEIKKLDAFMQLEEMRGAFSLQKAERYKELLDMKCSFLRGNIHENSIWDWRGSVNLLLTGKKREKKR